MATPEEVCEVQNLLAENYNVQIKPIHKQIWINCLGKYDVNVLRQCCFRLIETKDFMPKVNDFVQMIEGAEKEREQEIENTAIQQFNNCVWNQLGIACSYYDTFVFEDPITNKAFANMGGKNRFCQALEKDHDFLENKFVKVYKSLATTPNQRLNSNIHGYDNNRINLIKKDGSLFKGNRQEVLAQLSNDRVLLLEREKEDNQFMQLVENVIRKI